MTRITIGLLTLLSVGVGCRDGPLAVQPASPTALETPPVQPLDPLQLVASLLDDAFVRPLVAQIAGRASADQIVVALRPLADRPTERELTHAMTALEALRSRLLEGVAQGKTPARESDGAEDAEALILYDVLSLIVDGALQVVRNAVDSTGT
ncbi:MAG: hypothetical protein OEO20_03685 [Gemmatimonadota bacterium]|nr:hypothetical protein [Gemmatimonadota bacterium]MDH3367035.1 hypothetical protein [Gemmatimonadota bacterium]MDH3477386.1 hypothetical protein [Gemmatimonadota bacterium]MDH3571584.1 hypothetical protein [Gemmatimonadota bacterium]MDH5548756.1 hypothetical protein [Gemmatimonadota bacterium]